MAKRILLSPLKCTARANFNSLHRVFGFPITNSMVVTWVVGLSLIIFVKAATRKMKQVPTGAQNFLEWLVESLYGFLEGLLGRHLVDRTLPTWARAMPAMPSIGDLVGKFRYEAILYLVRALASPQLLTKHTGGMKRAFSVFQGYERGPMCFLNHQKQVRPDAVVNPKPFVVPEEETRLATFRNPYEMPTDWRGTSKSKLTRSR